MFEGEELKIKIVYFICILVVVMGVVSAFSTFLIGIVICVASLAVAACGAVGAKLKSHRLLWYYMAGLAILVLLSIASIIWKAIKARGFSAWMITDLILIIIYGSGIFVSYLLRDRSFRMNPKPANNFQKL
ncbi:hypothetical protein DLAC_08759 [Tieghemostelium lacteum]|uniref:Transmembrane protein n=1 Tax=Tieghemostelium lacteum TaxID=361077 RepID=A0A151Z8B1_TIELA|nr:hypothetical protein DLAC_08759 [Tieghemostelium lacteum]|eukprot:KYQ90168.1 hypothetical protein DLAC_08759 [Tieghemostelium lacteum]